MVIFQRGYGFTFEYHPVVFTFQYGYISTKELNPECGFVLNLHSSMVIFQQRRWNKDGNLWQIYIPVWLYFNIA